MNKQKTSFELKYLCLIMETFGLRQMATQSTKITANTSSIIDVMIISRQLPFSECKVSDCWGLSEHQLLECNLYFEQLQEDNRYVTYKISKDFIKNLSFYDLMNIDWTEIYNTEDINRRTEIFDLNQIQFLVNMLG